MQKQTKIFIILICGVIAAFTSYYLYSVISPVEKITNANVEFIKNRHELIKQWTSDKIGVYKKMSIPTKKTVDLLVKEYHAAHTEKDTASEISILEKLADTYEKEIGQHIGTDLAKECISLSRNFRYIADHMKKSDAVS